MRLKSELVTVAMTLAILSTPISSATVPRTATVPVIVCPTRAGTNSPPVPVPSSAMVPASAAHLVVYSARSAYIQVLGPKGMLCHAGIGADGSGSITARPSRSSDLKQGGIAAVAYPACTGCILELACPFFAAARKAAAQDGFPCPPQPPGQKTARLSAVAIAISDPPGEHVSPSAGSLVPSDSPYPTNGVVVYAPYTDNGHRGSAALEAVCVLPVSKHATCSAVLNEFLATQVKKFT